MDPQHAQVRAAAPIDSLSGLFLILFAKAIGYVVVLTAAFVIARRPPWSLGLVDLVFWGCAVAIPLTRQRVAERYEPPGADGAPVSLARRLAVHLGGAALLWVAVHSLQVAT